ncbi:MAG: creatininase family protein, partial [Thermomicrobiales bacterium]
MPGAMGNALRRDEIRSRLADGALVVLPTAATEQHGPHLPTGHDSVTVEHIARAAADASLAEVILAPVLCFGSSQHHLPFGGTLSLSTETYYHVARDLVESILASGARRVLLLNGHGGNQQLN